MIGWRDRRVPLIAVAGLGAVVVVAVLVFGGSATAVISVAGLVTGLLAAVSLVTASAKEPREPRESRESREPREPGESREPRAPIAWRWLVGGALTWLFGTGVRPVAVGTAFALTFADLLLLVGSLLLMIGCWLTAVPPTLGRGVLRRLTEAYLSAASIFAITWVLVLGPLLRAAEQPVAFYVTLALPVVCLLATCVVTPIVVGSRGENRLVGLAGLLVLITITVGEHVVAVSRINGDDGPPLAAGLLAPVAFTLLAVTPWLRLRVRQTVAGRVIVSAAPYTLVAVGTAVVAFGTAGGDGVALSIVGASVVGVLLARLFGLMLSTDGMRRQMTIGERQLLQLAENTGDVVLMCDNEGVVHEISPGIEATYGYDPSDVVGLSVFDYIHPEDVPALQAQLRRVAEDESDERFGTCRIACRVRAADGTWRPTESVATRHVRNEELILITTRDVSDQVALRNQVTHLTFHDGVTGLPNRAYFEERVRDVLPRVSRAAVIFLDLDGFTGVNDSVGHASGDYLLGQAARRLRATVRADDTLARWGGDEFAVLLESGNDAQLAVDLAERLVRAVSSEPFRVADRDIALTASVGIAFAVEETDGESGTGGETTAGDLLRNADVAMARAKGRGGRRVEVFAAHMHADAVRRLEIAADLQRALLENQFAIEYQPVVDLATSRVTAVEALVRWWHDGTFVPPEQFLDTAEDTGLIVPLSEWILRESCREVAAWRASEWDIGLSLNLSQRQITAPGFVETIAEALEESGLPPSALTLEVIEEMLVEDAEDTIEKLSRLRALGVGLAIDDFGTGYASLAFLRQVPVDMIKIDPSFVSGLGRDDTLTLLTRTIVRLGHDLGLIVVAEGIERPEQLEALREMGCSRGQGYLVARPMAAQNLDSMMRTTLQNTA